MAGNDPHCLIREMHFLDTRCAFARWNAKQIGIKVRTIDDVATSAFGRELMSITSSELADIH